MQCSLKFACKLISWYARAYARGRGFGVNPPVELDILQKFYYLCKEIKCFRILFAC